MRVKDELSGQEYEARQVIWILGSNGGHTSRTRSIPHGIARGFEVAPLQPGAKPWALNADGDEWFPVEVLP